MSNRIGTTSRGDHGLFMKRIPVNSCDDLPLFQAKLSGAYDWLHAVQYSAKSVKGILGGSQKEHGKMDISIIIDAELIIFYSPENIFEVIGII